MAFKQYKVLLIVVCVVAALFAVSPILEQFIVAPKTESFTELYLLGAHHNTTYPSNVSLGETYHFYIDVANHLGSDANYVIEVKFVTQTEDAPDSFKHTPSSLPSLDSITCPVANEETLELPVDVSFGYALKPGSVDQLDVQNITINGETKNVDSTLLRDPVRGGFYGGLVFELWLQNETSGSLQYHQRYVSLWLEMT